MRVGLWESRFAFRVCDRLTGASGAGLDVGGGDYYNDSYEQSGIQEGGGASFEGD